MIDRLEISTFIQNDVDLEKKDLNVLAKDILDLLKDKIYFDVPTPAGNHIYHSILNLDAEEKHTRKPFRVNIAAAKDEEIPYYLIALAVLSNVEYKFFDAIERIKKEKSFSYLLALDFRHKTCYFYNPQKLSHQSYIEKAGDRKILKGYKACDYSLRNTIKKNKTEMSIVDYDCAWKINILHAKILKNLNLEFRRLKLEYASKSDDPNKSDFDFSISNLDLSQNNLDAKANKLRSLHLEIKNWYESYDSWKKSNYFLNKEDL